MKQEKDDGVRQWTYPNVRSRGGFLYNIRALAVFPALRFPIDDVL